MLCAVKSRDGQVEMVTQAFAVGAKTPWRIGTTSFPKLCKLGETVNWESDKDWEDTRLADTSAHTFSVNSLHEGEGGLEFGPPTQLSHEELIKEICMEHEEFHWGPLRSFRSLGCVGSRHL